MGKFWHALKHAFAVESEEYELTEEEKKVLEQFADEIVKRGLTVPTILFAQSSKPLSFIGSQVMLILRPIIQMIYPTTTVYDKLQSALEKRKGLEYFIETLEAKSTQ